MKLKSSWFFGPHFTFDKSTNCGNHNSSLHFCQAKRYTLLNFYLYTPRNFGLYTYRNFE